MKTRTDYDLAFQIVKGVVDAWDPYGLLAGGAPRDEFESEVGKLLPRLRDVHSSEDATREISAVFARAFEPGKFTPELCSEVGAQLYSALQKAGLLSTR